MVEYICLMNRLNWVENPGTDVRRGDRFDVDDEERARIWLREGYIRLADVEDEGASGEVPDSDNETTLDTDNESTQRKPRRKKM